jgi:polyribonucleotide nucleotidyltransferase
MNEVITEARSNLSQHAPRITTIKVKPDQVRVVIGPGGKMIKGIIDQTGVSIDVSDDGTIAIASSDADAVNKAIHIIQGLTTEPEIGRPYTGIVKRIEPYGAFLEVLPGKDGLLHISDMAWEHVEKVEDVVQMGAELEVVISNIDRDNRIRLSRKELLPKPEGYDENAQPPRRDREDRGGGGRGGGRDGGGGRGGRDDRRPGRPRN